MKYLLVLTIGLFLMNSCGNYNEIEEFPNELNVYNDLLDTLYSKELCRFHMIPPECLPKKPSEEYVKEYNEEYAKFKKSFYSANLIVHIDDTLKELNLRNVHEFIIEQLEPQDSLYKNLILERSIVLKPRIFDIDSLNQEGINFRYLSKVKKLGKFNFGKDSTSYNIGVMKLSRICFNKSFDIGICYFLYIADPDCGYGQYLFIKKESNKWILHKEITDVVF